jgi:hypothetical protein
MQKGEGVTIVITSEKGMSIEGAEEGAIWSLIEFKPQ